MKLNLLNKTLLAYIVLTMLLSLHSCHSKKADYFHVFDIELASQLNNSKSQMEVNEFELLINLFNNTRYTYYLSDEKEKLVNNLDLGDQQFRLTEVYKEGSVNAFQFVDYKGMSFKINNESSNSNGIRGLDWDLVEIKNRKKTFWGFDCHFAEGFSIVDDIEYSISGYICPDFKTNLSYVQGTNQVENFGIWAEVKLRMDGFEIEYRITNYSKILLADVLFPNEEKYDTLEFDENFTSGFTKWLQN